MIPLVAPCYSRDELDAFNVQESWVESFETAFAERVGCAEAVAVCSGTVALELALRTLGVRDVSVPTYTCQAVRQATRWTGKPVGYLDSRWDVGQAQMILQKPRNAGVVTHMFGRPTITNWQPVVEDWTLSFGAEMHLEAELGVCSTHHSKMVSTGRGGVVFGDDPELIEWVRGLAEQMSVGMSAGQAALGVSQLGQLDDFIYRRRALAGHYTYAFQRAGIPCPAIGTGSVFFRYLIAVDDPAAKVELLAVRGIECGRGVLPPLHRRTGWSDDGFPGATWCVENLLSVPCHPSVTDDQAEFIAEQIVEVCAT